MELDAHPGFPVRALPTTVLGAGATTGFFGGRADCGRRIWENCQELSRARSVCARRLTAEPPTRAPRAAAVKGRARGNRGARGPAGAGRWWRLRGMRGSARGFSNMAAAV